MSRRDLLASVAQTPRSTSAGPCDLPILYRDGAQLGVFYASPLEAARAVLARTSLEPWPLFGRAITTIQAWSYRDSTVGSYGEVGLGIVARKKGSRPSLLKLGMDMRDQEEQGIWVCTLPVTTEAAWAAGVELWGYPKYVTPITSDFGAREARVRLGDELEITVEAGRGLSLPSLPVVTLTSLGGRLIRTVIETQMALRWTLGRTANVRILGRGPTADAFEALGLEGVRPLSAFRTDAFRAVLPEGRDIGAAGSG
ncbi:MAG: acetoacetate decarboxylase family protein [Polyangiaceae bacterium]